jgi:nicotinamide mononucleotide transporter
MEIQDIMESLLDMTFNLYEIEYMEVLAVLLSILYLLLAVRQNILCWLAGILSSTLYIFIMYSAGLYMEACLQVFYIAMGFYGLSQWKSNESKFLVRSWNSTNHFKVVSLILLLTLGSGYLLEIFTDAALPFFDALTTWGAVVATYMVAKKLIENWIYFFVIDFISVFLFVSRDLYLTAALFVGYLIIIFFGYQSWNQMRANS